MQRQGVLTASLFRNIRTHSHARAWSGAGWRMAKVRIDEETVIFDRVDG